MGKVGYKTKVNDKASGATHTHTHTYTHTLTPSKSLLYFQTSQCCLIQSWIWNFIANTNFTNMNTKVQKCNFGLMDKFLYNKINFFIPSPTLLRAEISFTRIQVNSVHFSDFSVILNSITFKLNRSLRCFLLIPPPWG